MITLKKRYLQDDLANPNAVIKTKTTEKTQTNITHHQVLGELRQELANYKRDLGEEEVADVVGRESLSRNRTCRTHTSISRKD